MSGKVWLCVETRPDGSFVFNGDTGKGGVKNPYRPHLCYFGGWLNHLEDCGWYRLRLVSS